MNDYFSHCRFFLIRDGLPSEYPFYLESDDPDWEFSKEMIQSRHPKIYVVKSEKTFLYVGYASQSLITRLKQGFKASGENGYHGYKWKKLEKVEINAFVFPILADSTAKESRLYFEAIEADLVFQIRTRTGKWPLHQNEIHFNNEFSVESMKVAGKLMEELL